MKKIKLGKWIVGVLLVFSLNLTFGCSRKEKSVTQGRLRLATTTSTENSGLLEVLLPPFEEQFKLKVDVISVGTAQALRLGKNGDVDVVLVHARAAEEEFIRKGFGVNRREVMYNDFVIVGPPSDPAKIKEAKEVKEAFGRIASGKVLFISRADNSGTHKKEMTIWEKTGLRPSGRWYLETGKGMAEVLTMANEKRAYTLTDRGTYLTYAGKIDLPILSEGDPLLYNPYGIIAVNPAKHPHVNYVSALALIDWVTSPEGQRIIRDYKKFDTLLFYPLAIPGVGDM
jgi:tungstate transport system substrate-binding protein